jgi:fluoride exporter
MTPVRLCLPGEAHYKRPGGQQTAGAVSLLNLSLASFGRSVIFMRTWLVRCMAVGLAGFIGAVLRYWIGLLAGRLQLTFPLATLIINVTGSFFLGWFLTWAPRSRQISDVMILAIATGFVGAYTTFSTYMYESNKLLSAGALYEAMANLVGSLLLGLLAVRLGVYLGGGFQR